MKALFVAWQDSITRQWVPVGKLEKHDGLYVFFYTKGASKFKSFRPFGAMSKLEAEYTSTELFPLFANRVLSKNRPEYPLYISWLGLDGNVDGDMEELGRTGGVRATDTLELIPEIKPTAEDDFVTTFFARGVRHLPPSCQSRISELKPGSRLFLMKDVQNESDSEALILRTDDPVEIVGYLPRYYARPLSRLLEGSNSFDVVVTVQKVNLDAPVRYRLLCRIQAPWPQGFSLYEDDNFQPLVSPLARSKVLVQG